MIGYVIEFFIIFGACLCAEMLVGWVQNWRSRKLDIGCDYCEEAKITYRTHDKAFWLCRTCMEVYMEERGLSDEEKDRARNRYTKNAAK